MTSYTPFGEYQVFVLRDESHARVPGFSPRSTNLAVLRVPQDRRYLEIAVLLPGKTESNKHDNLCSAATGLTG